MYSTAYFCSDLIAIIESFHSLMDLTYFGQGGGTYVI